MTNAMPIRTEGNIVFVTHDAVGESSVLGYRLMQGLLNTIANAGRLPRRIVFVNRGVFLTCRDDPVDVIEPLRRMQQAGVEIHSCGTCLEHFGLQQELRVGQVGNMASTVDALLSGTTTLSL